MLGYFNEVGSSRLKSPPQWTLGSQTANSLAGNLSPPAYLPISRFADIFGSAGASPSLAFGSAGASPSHRLVSLG